ncbi:L-sorbose 1-dehydrogenase-like [Oppia nitens]|uniref:L-sorbose 1-dehydrogenase-like n=1 Tax=Oppia nitens TaxID=1686743 RepID=UPI0023DB3C87|nr:L-sorbose 1-dehydrogenase-like [Oppia nitens]
MVVPPPMVPSLILQMMTVAMISIDRQIVYNKILERNTHLHDYDYIVVGAGASGAVVANRLTEDQSVRVLLLEAGGPQTVVTDIPGLSERLVDDPQYDWRYRTVPQIHFTNSPMDANLGKAIGGSSTINGMLYNRGNRRDFDNWRDQYGARGWSYDELLPYFIKSENNTDGKLVSENREFHGTSGPIAISTDPDPHPMLLLHNKVLNDLGIPTLDVNGDRQLGTTLSQSFLADGLRSSTANAYIDPNPHEDNMHIITSALVTKILFDDKSHPIRAIGVQFEHKEASHTVYAKKEVILCAGAVRSPQLLMLSGIGPADHLEKFHIPVLQDLPVGDNLQDHPAVTIHTLIKDAANNGLANRPALLNTQELYELFVKRGGPLAYATDTLSYFSSTNNSDPQWPNIFYYTKVQYIQNLNVISSEHPTSQLEWQEYYRPYLNQYLFQIGPHLYRCRSYGSIRLQSTDPKVQPLIDPNFLAHPQDREDFIEVIRFALWMVEESKLAQYLTQLAPVLGCRYCKDRPQWKCDSYIQCLMVKTGKTGYHLTGGNRMGDPRRKDTVLDPDLRVKHVQGLRVCDASVMPEIINANTYAISVAIGEKCADLLKQQQHNH